MATKTVKTNKTSKATTNKATTATTANPVHAKTKSEIETATNTEAQAQDKAVETTEWAKKMAKIQERQEYNKRGLAILKAMEESEKKRPGVIKTILHIIKESETPISQTQILTKLKLEFPKREEKSMTNTIKAQIGGKKRPLRMEREKQVIFEIAESKAGVKLYSIAHIEETEATE